METYANIKNHVNAKLAVKQINEYIVYMANSPVTSSRSYAGLDEYSGYKYSYIHDMLKRHRFVNGEPSKNTAAKNPMAALWFFIYGMAGNDYIMEDDNHHASTLKRRDNFVKGLRILALGLQGYSLENFISNKKTIITSDGRKYKIGKATKINYYYGYGIEKAIALIWNTKGKIVSLSVIDFA